METATYVVPDISCDHCKHVVEAAVGDANGVKSVNVDVEAQTVNIEFDGSQVTPSQIAAILDDAGYPPRPEPT